MIPVVVSQHCQDLCGFLCSGLFLMCNVHALTCTYLFMSVLEPLGSVGNQIRENQLNTRSIILHVLFKWQQSLKYKWNENAVLWLNCTASNAVGNIPPDIYNHNNISFFFKLSLTILVVELSMKFDKKSVLRSSKNGS